MDNRLSKQSNSERLTFCNLILQFEKAVKEKHPDFAEKAIRRYANKAIREKLNQDFFVDKNEAMNCFIHGKVLDEERSGVSKTYFIPSVNRSDKLLGFVTLRLDVLSLEKVPVEERKLIILKGKIPNNIVQIPWLLIEEVAKNFKIKNNPIHLDDLLDIATSMFNDVQSMVGGDVVGLNALNESKLICKYKSYGFEPFGDPIPSHANPNVTYQPMFLRMSSLRTTD